MSPNPPTAVTLSDELRGHVVRLECPVELTDRAWDGPVYVRLLQSRHIRPGRVSPFVVDDSSRRPGWVCQLIYCRTEGDDANAVAEDPTPQNVVIPFSRLTRPSNDLSRELRDRPLLLLFRFVRFKSCYMASPGSTPRRFVEVPLAVFLVGQVVAYLPSDGATFSAPSGATLQPTARYQCVVAVRQPADGQAVHVVIPCNSAWDSIISRDEFVVGWCHGVPATSQPARRMARFRSRWSEFVITPSQDAILQRLLHDTFAPSGSDTQVDFGTQRLRLITEFGRVITVSPLSYAKTYIGPARPSTRMDIDEDSDSESPAEILEVGFSRGLPLPRSTPDIVRQDELPLLSPPVPRTWYSFSPPWAIQFRAACRAVLNPPARCVARAGPPRRASRFFR
ncbi:hypothetical protein PR003_g9831 [Phytophthora rubi]|uniref:Uncharacterized protein n=1 Tax=Phytophthora rubi TaxID=129364 RepID=A0A6A4FT33_9STRA|nr:hypothetical protein PR002_g9176 [Phytophthora rubi]KAE9341733.1 hypothetical protein PR003_g9831 [Phytophthora rubi]